MASRAFSSSSSSYAFAHDVFLSFRGEDTRYGFTGNLHKALDRVGIRTFIDDKDLQGGEEITPSLLTAIENSRIAIIVLSKNYASSSFCLDELVKILDCLKAEKSQLVLPVFYDVDPSDVRHLRRTYGEAMAKHEGRLKDNMLRLEKWKMALKKVADLSGYHFKHGEGYEHKFVSKIVEQVSKKISCDPLPITKYPIGLESRVLEVKSLLDVGSRDRLRMVGIHGTGGIGKTTLALAVYNSIAEDFEGLCFLKDVRENSQKHGLVHLQQILLSKILGGKKIELASVDEGISKIQQRLQQKKVLLILDDVNHKKQLEALVGGSNWFGFGSRVIITTRDQHLLALYDVGRTYEVRKLNDEDARELLSLKAFKNGKVDSSYVDVLNSAVSYASGLPLALEVIGSNLFQKSIEEWKSALEQYKRNPAKEIQEILKVSYDALEEDEKKTFLDICCLKGYKLVYVKNILRAHHDEDLAYAIRVLVEKSLIQIIGSDYVTLHDLVQDMGKEIIRQESPEEPGERSRLWVSKDIVRVLEENTGTSKIQMINLHLPKSDEVTWDGEAFGKMKNLKTLVIKQGRFSQGPKHLPNSLRVLEWWGYPSMSLPSDFHPKKLATMKLPASCLTSLQLKLPTKFVNLRVLNFDFCKNITEIPDVSGVPNLEEFSVQWCESLIKIHESIGFLDKLKILNAENCRMLRSFPPIIKLTSLEELRLAWCPSLERFSEILSKMEKITKLALAAASIKELPVSFQNFVNLRTLSFVLCKNITEIPDLSSFPVLESFTCGFCESLIKIHESIGFLDKLKGLSANECRKLRDFPPINLTSLERLDLSGCSSLQRFPEILGKMENITELWLDGVGIKELPVSIKNLTGLEFLDLRGMGTFQLSSSILELPKLDWLNIADCHALLLPKQNEGEEQVSSMISSIKYLRFSHCNISDEFLQTCLPWFPNLEELDLSRNDFTILPASIQQCLPGFPNLKRLDLSGNDFTILPEFIQQCRFLTYLSLDDCESLREIEGIPPNIEVLLASNCKSLSSSSRNKLLNERWHAEGGDKELVLPGTTPPEWFKHCREAQSISFWFRNKFPAISLCAVSGQETDQIVFRAQLSNAQLLDNSKTSFFHWEEAKYLRKKDQVHIIDRKHIQFNCNVDEMLSENEWNHVEFSVVSFDSKVEEVVKHFGVHVFKNESSMDDIRFTDSSTCGELDEGQGREWISLLPPGLPPALNDNMNWNSSSMVSTPICGSTTGVQGLLEQQLTSIDQQNFEGCETDKAKGKGRVSLAATCNSDAEEENGFQVTSEKYQSASSDKTMAWDPTELEYQVPYPKDQFVSNDESTVSDNGCHVMRSESNQRSGKRQICLSAFITFCCVPLIILLFSGYSASFSKLPSPPPT